MLLFLLPAGAVHAATQTLDYALSSHGLHLADIEARTQLTDQGYAITVHSRTVGLVGAIARSDITSVSSGRFDGGRALPLSYQTTGHSWGADRVVRIGYVDGAPKVLALTPPEPDREPVDDSQTRGSIDLLSAMVELAHRVSDTGHCESQALVFDGKRLSRLEAHDGAVETLPPADGQAFAGRAMRCDFVSRQLGGFMRGDDRARRLTPLHGSTWMAAPAPGLPIAAVRAVLESPLFGRATLILTKTTS
jgi:hypothetical protein